MAVIHRRRTGNDAVLVSARLVAVVGVAYVATLVLPGLLALGIVPRTLAGLLGIAFAPFLHASMAHLLANAFPLFVLLVLLFADRGYKPGWTLSFIWGVSGAGTWLIGRGPAVHVGASSIIYGLVAYLVASGLMMRSWRAVLVSLFVLLLYGGVWYGVLPQRGPVSWEGHLCGAIAGLIAARWRHGR